MYPYQDPSLSTEERIADLLSRMSLEEKFAQLRLVRFPGEKAREVPFDLNLLEEDKHRCGALYNNYSIPAERRSRIQIISVRQQKKEVTATIWPVSSWLLL